MFWALGVPSWREAFRESGSSLLTLGFAPADTVSQTLLMFSEAASRSRWRCWLPTCPRCAAFPARGCRHPARSPCRIAAVCRRNDRAIPPHPRAGAPEPGVARLGSLVCRD
jgi:hypothetical protein